MGFDDLEAAEREHQDSESSSDGTAEQIEETTTDSTAESMPDSTTESSAGPATDSTDGAETDSTTGSSETSSSENGGPNESGKGSTEVASETVSDTPAFEYGEVKQSPLYARPAAWNALEDALDLEVVRALREAGIRNEEKRELHDAVLRVAAEHPEEIAAAVEATRRGDE